MVAKAILAFCASALFVQSTIGQCLGRMAGPIAPCRGDLVYDGFTYDGLALDGVWPKRAGCGAIAPAAELAASHGGGLAVSSASCAPPTGLAVASENAYEGCVSVAGNLPFLGTAAMEGVFPTAGASAISYGCGDGVVAITAEGSIDAAYAPIGIAPAAIAPAAIAPAAIAPAVSSWGYKGIPARGCGCGTPYMY